LTGKTRALMEPSGRHSGRAQNDYVEQLE